ncbi:MAG: hypothetical protein ABWZ80_07840 [Beijerinckiaceae bacterium]
MNFDPATLSERLLPWVQRNWEWLVAGLIILIIAIVIRRLLSRAARRPSAAKSVIVAPETPDTQKLDVATAASAEISADIEAYARALFTEDMAMQAERAAANAPQHLRFATIAEAPFIYDGVIMRDVALLPTSLIAPVSNHFRQAQHILDSLRRQSLLTSAENSADERIAALRSVAQALAQGLDRATHAAEKLDQWLAKNGGAFEPPRGLADLPMPQMKGVHVERVGQRAKAFRTLREVAHARLAEIEGFIDAARRSHHLPAGSGRTLPPSRTAPSDLTVVKPEEKRAAE